MSIVDDVMTDRITLHGLGFVQVQLPAEQRLHVWHPDLPRRHCFEHSAIHDHRFNFESRVLVGEQVNIHYDMELDEGGEYVLYLHEGARTACGGRPWVPDGRARMTEQQREVIPAGQTYFSQAYRYHRTEPGGDGRVATIMTKNGESQRGAHSSCLFGVKPDDQFDRYQWSPSQLWEIVRDVLVRCKPAPMIRTLTIPIEGVYFEQIKAGTKPEEFRLANDYWRKRLEGRTYDRIELTWGYPKRGDTERRLVLPWRGYRLTTITHPHFGPAPVEVFAINVEVSP